MASIPHCPTKSDDRFGPRVSLQCRSFDFTLLFEDAIFTALPAAVLLLTLPSRLQFLHKTPSKLGSYRLAVYKLFLLSALFIAQLLFVVFRSQTVKLHTRASLPADTIQAVATFATIYASLMEDQRSVRPSDILTIYFSTSSILSLARLRSLWLISSEPICRGLWTSVVVLTIAILVFESFTKTNFLRPTYRNITKEQAQSIWGRTFFTYTIPFFRAGFLSILELEDIPAVDQNLQGRGSGQKLRDAWIVTKGSHRLVRAAFRAFPWFFVSAILPRLLLTGFTFAQPFLITATIQYMQSPVTESSRHYGAALVGAFVLVYVGLATTTSIYWRQTYRLITVLRSGLISTIYDQTLLLQSNELSDAAAITLMGTDVERIVVNMKNFHESWASILEVGIAIWLLEGQLWVACLVPLVISLASVFGMMPLSARSGDAQKRWIEKVQKRLAVTSSMLQDMKVVQMLGLSDVLETVISQLRIAEIKTSMRYRKLVVWQIALSNMPTDLAPFVTFGVYTAISVLHGNETILAVRAFTALALISLLTNPLLKLCQVMSALYQVIACFDRVEKYCLKEVGSSLASFHSEHLRGEVPVEIELQRRQSSHSLNGPVVSMQNATISKSPDTSAILHNINLTINRGITMVVGPVGSGKSTLLESILGENALLSGTSSVSLSEVAYCPQTSWIQNTTIRQNILGPLEYDGKWYDFTIAACGLEKDLEIIPGGDSSVTGSSGASLSGGQRQRIALARAVYSRLPVVVLDDILSGLDSKTVKLVQETLFSEEGHFRQAGRSVIFVTNSNDMYKYADNVIVLDEGQLVAQGPFTQIVKQSPEVAARFLLSTQKDNSLGGEDFTVSRSKNLGQIVSKREQGKAEEKIDILRQKGSWSVYGYYFKCAGYLPLFLTFAFTALESSCNVFGAILLQWWVEANERQPNQHIGLYVGVYGVIFVLSVIGMFGGCWALLINVLNNSSFAMHLELLQAALRAPIVHFQTIDIGAITNRFGQDLELIDMTLPVYSIQFLTAAIICLIRLVILCVLGKYLAAAVPFLLFVLYVVQSFYLRTSRQVRLLDIEAKAPLYTHFLETIQGISSIRAFGWGSAFQSKSEELLDQSQKPVYMLFRIQQWLTLVLDLSVGGVAIILIAIITSWKDRFSAVQVGVALNLLLSFNFALAQMIRMWTQMEMAIGAVARIQQFVQKTPSEKQQSHSGTLLPVDWPPRGAIEFHKIVAGYSPNNPALSNINLEIHPGTKTLICGASGSGKTSLLMSLLQMLPISSGHITIDGINTSNFPPKSIREAINVIPQAAFFMPGSLRTNVDPKQQSSDEKITEAILKVGLWDKVREAGGLDHEFEAEKWSVGQKQLLALARALLAKSTILILDEVTSSVDHETETLMQNIIEKEFNTQTVLVVAHRFRFLEWFDQIVVIKQQRIVEQGSFEELIATNGEFSRLYHADGARKKERRDELS